MSRNKSTPLLNGYARAILERFNSPSFHALFLTTSKFLKPLFLQRFVTISWVFWAPPKPSTRTFSGHNKITAKVRFVNKVGALFVSRKRFWNPYFYSVSRDKIENASFFLPLPCPISKPTPFAAKTLALGGSACFSPNSPTMKKAEKYIDPSRLALPERPPNKVNHKMKAPKPTRKTSSQDMKLKNQHDHTAAKKQQPKMRKINKTKEQISAKLQRNRSTQNKKNTNTKQNGSQKCWHKRQVGQKEGSSPHTKTTI